VTDSKGLDCPKPLSAHTKLPVLPLHNQEQRRGGLTNVVQQRLEGQRFLVCGMRKDAQVCFLCDDSSDG